MSDDKKSLLERLGPDAAQRLQGLTSEISYEKVTVSFSLDGRDANGLKRNAFYSLTVGRREYEGAAKGFTADELRVLRCILSKQVVSTVYDDAVKRLLLPGNVAKDELTVILERYDNQLVKLLKPEGTEP
jgi:hypothetical protein